MALSIPTATKNLILEYIESLIDQDTDVGYAQFEVDDTADSLLAKINLNRPSFEVAASGSMALDTTGLENTNTTKGTVGHLSFYSGDDTERLEFPASTTTTSGYCYMSSLSLATGDTVEITSCTLNMANN
jgi:hypothetical protein